jgi:hypothetical protein
VQRAPAKFFAASHSHRKIAMVTATGNTIGVKVAQLHVK